MNDPAPAMRPHENRGDASKGEARPGKDTGKDQRPKRDGGDVSDPGDSGSGRGQCLPPSRGGPEGSRAS